MADPLNVPGQSREEKLDLSQFVSDTSKVAIKRDYNITGLSKIDTINDIGKSISTRMSQSLKSSLTTSSNGTGIGLKMIDAGSNFYTPIVSSSKLAAKDSISAILDTDADDGTGPASQGGDGEEGSVNRDSNFNFFDSSITEDGKKYKTNKMGTGIGRSKVINPPFQFNPHDDVRSDLYFPHLGRVYNEKIVSNYPIAYFEVGKIKYNTNLFTNTAFEGGDDKTILNYIRDGGGNLVEKGFIAVKTVLVTSWNVATFPLRLGTEGLKWVLGLRKYAIFVPQYNLFHKYVNDILRQVATMMGLLNGSVDDAGGEVKYYGDEGTAMDETLLNQIGEKFRDNESFGNDWTTKVDNKVENALDGYVGRLISLRLASILYDDSAYGSEFIPYMINKDVSISESINNSTSQNPLQSSLNGEAATAQNEAINNYSNDAGANAAQSFLDSVKARVDRVGKTLLRGDSGTVLSGEGRISLPEVWTDSSFSRSVSMSFKFTSPYGDNLSIFENTYIPFLLLFAMTMPRQIGSKTYTNPFVVRVSSNGLFNVPMGIIESLSIERGEDKNNWTIDNKPRTIKCNVSIKDISPVMMMSMNRGLFFSLFMGNDSYSQYLSLLGGLSLTDQRNILKRAGRWFKNLEDTFKAGGRFLSSANGGNPDGQHNFGTNILSALGLRGTVAGFQKNVASTEYDSVP